MAYPYHAFQMEAMKLIAKPGTVGSRIKAFCTKYDLTYEQFAFIANAFAKQYGSRVTPSDINNYINCGNSPKIDKLTAISMAMQCESSWFAGYGKNEPNSKNPALIIRAWKKKARKVKVHDKAA